MQAAIAAYRFLNVEACGQDPSLLTANPGITPLQASLASQLPEGERILARRLAARSSSTEAPAQAAAAAERPSCRACGDRASGPGWAAPQAVLAAPCGQPAAFCCSCAGQRMPALPLPHAYAADPAAPLCVRGTRPVSPHPQRVRCCVKGICGCGPAPAAANHPPFVVLACPCVCARAGACL